MLLGYVHVSGPYQAKMNRWGHESRAERARIFSPGNECTKTGDEMTKRSGRATTRPSRPLATAVCIFNFGFGPTACYGCVYL